MYILLYTINFEVNSIIFIELEKIRWKIQKETQKIRILRDKLCL